MKAEKLSAFLISQDAEAVEALQKIDANARGILFVVSSEQRLKGVITDGDIRRWLIKTGNLKESVDKIMNADPKVIYRKDLKTAQVYMEKHSITALPVVDTRGNILDIVFRTDIKKESAEISQSLQEVPVVIMAGGKGTRLYPYTKILPKPLIPIGNIPIMERIIGKFCDFGVKDFFVTVNYRKSMIKSYFSDLERSYTLTYVEEDKPLGTAGSLKLIDGVFERPFLVTNCDILVRADYGDIYEYHKDSGNDLTLVTALKNIVVPYGVVHSSENGVVLAMDEKPRLSYFINTGMYVLNPEILHEIPQDTFYHMTDLADKLLREHRKVGMYPISEDSFLDMGDFEEMHRMEEKLNLKSE